MYKEVDIDDYKNIYEDIVNKIDDIYNYYNVVMDNIEQVIYMSPADYLISRNISYIYSAIEYAKKNIDTWYQLIENKRKIRVVVNHNNLTLDHYLKNTKSYLISWRKADIDMPIYDLISLYKNNYLDFDFTELLDIYLSKYPITEEETILFLTLISIPNKISKNESMYKTVINIRRELDYLYKTSDLVRKYNIKKDTQEG